MPAFSGGTKLSLYDSLKEEFKNVLTQLVHLSFPNKGQLTVVLMMEGGVECKEIFCNLRSCFVFVFIKEDIEGDKTQL